MSDIVERLSANVNWLMRDGFETSAKNVQCALAEIESLRQQLKDVTGQHHVALEAEQVRFRQLAASQAREAQLREALHSVPICYHSKINGKECACGSCESNHLVEKALALPQDTSALEAMIAEAGEVMRDLCADTCETSLCDCRSYWDKLRTLPGVTIEDLQ